MAIDPTGTTRIRARYERDITRRFKRLERTARRAVLVDDALGIAARFAADIQFDPDPKPSFAGFQRSEEKARAFSQWLNAQAAKGILEVREGTPITVTAEHGWQNKYIDSAYRKGMRDSDTALGRKRSTANLRSSFLGPVHADRAGLLYSRNLEALEGITEAMSEQIRDVLAQGLIDGKHPRVLAKLIKDRVDKVGITRARTLARTETIAAHAEATLNTYQEAGVLEVSNDAEFTTSADGRVCPTCSALSGRTYSLDDARGVIPVHPNCRCRWLPVIREDLPEAE